MRTALGILYTDLGIDRADRWEEDAAWVEDAVSGLLAQDPPGGPEPGRCWRRCGGRPADRAGHHDVPEAGRPGVIARTQRGPRRAPFDLTVCGDEVPALKPDPAPYLQA
jgi:hypothetical protein